MIHPQLFYQHQACCKNTIFFKPAEFELKMPGSENPLWLSEVQSI